MIDLQQISKKYSANVPFLYPQKMREKYTFSDDLKGYGKEALA